MKILFSIIFSFVLFQVQAQFGFQQIITSQADMPTSVFAADINGDGYQDIITASRVGAFNIAWFENTDGSGTFGIPHIIDTNLFDEVYFVYGADLDNDGDIDVLTTSYGSDKVIWYENLDGHGNFSGQKVLDSNAEGAFSVIAADLDGDGDMDVISASRFSGLAWYENLNGHGHFSPKKIIDNQISSSRSVVAVDLDGDGDLDILGNATGTDKIFWIENLDGLGNFGSRQIIDSTGLYANVVFAADIDGDGDMDVVFASNGDNEVAWYENLDGLGNFGPKQTITNTLHKAWTVYAADLDNDGDIDVLATSVETFGGEVVWFENLDGLGNFSSKKIISTEVKAPKSVIAADIDGDGAMDVVSASQNDDKVAWYRNLSLGIEENYAPKVKIYPNPSNGTLFIELTEANIFQIIIFDVLGKNVLQIQGNKREIDISGLQSGIYFLRVTTENGTLYRKIIKE